MRRGQMMAIAALMTSAIAPYAVSADTNGAVSTTAASSYIESAVDYTVTASMDGLADRLKSSMVGDVNLKIDSEGKKYAQIAFVKSSYGFVSFADTNDKALTPISTTGEAGTTSLVRVIEVELDDKYQAVVKVNAPNFGGNHTLTFDLATEKFDFGFDSSLPTNNAYFKLWAPNGDVVTLKDGKKVAYVTFAGHSYAVSKIFEGSNNSKEAKIVSSKGSAETKDLTRVVRLELDANNKAQVFLDGGAQGSYTFTFDFTEKAATAKFATAAELAKASSLVVEYAAVDTTAGSWHPMAFPSAASNPVAKAVNGKIQVTYDLTKVKSFKATQGGKDVAVTVANDKATFTVDTLEGLAFEVTADAERNGTVTEATYKVSLTKAQAGEAIVEETPVTAIPSTTNVKGKKASVTFKASSDSLNAYFQKGFFNGVEIVEIDGQSYADLNIIEKSIGLEYDYILPNGTKGDVLEISGNRATQNGNYEGFSAVVRIPVTVNDKGEFTFTLDTFGGQPGTENQAAYQFTFTGKIQNNVTLPYTDIKSEETKAYVQQLANYGALNLELSKFNPTGNVTRGQFALMIARALELKPAKANQFKDVKDAELSAAVQALFEAGIIKGYENNTKFDPNAQITRTQAAIMIDRLLTGKLGYKSNATAADLNFNDGDDVKSEEARKAFAVLQKAEIMTGSNGFIKPASKLTRAQMAKILVESLNKAGFEK